MERYESKQVQIHRPAMDVYLAVSDFRHFTPMLEDKVEGWEATEDTCSFRVKGIPARLRMAERDPGKLIKMVGEEGSPVDFAFWLQLVSVDESDTRMRLVLDVELNTMLKMMVGGKLKDGMDLIADQIAEAFNTGKV